ncbi:MAG: hypothetical protein MI861_27505, partial [Pirellulales bacterium]|nr:hypothetical protein [Pirellulales bacterium]
MGLRHVAQTARALTLFAAATLGLSSVSADDGANVRIATYQTPSGDGYFAASVQPSADDELLAAVRSAPADVVVIVDTSASQVGDFKADSMAALTGVASKLRSNDRIRIFAGDVSAVDLSGSFDAVRSQVTRDAVAKLKKRLPLGNTNMVAVMDAVRAALVTGPDDHTRSIVYVGDATSIDATGDAVRFEGLIKALRADRIAVHSVAIGPTTNLELMAILANQTGGVLGVVSGKNEPEFSPRAIGNFVGQSACLSPIWLQHAKLLDGMDAIQADRLPPLRVDRDSILLGKYSAETAQGTIELRGQTSTSAVKIVAAAALEEAHPDFSFLPGLVSNARDDGGLMLPSAGSPLLRETARMLASQAEELVRASNMALQQGNRRGAKAVAEKALEADPENQDAKALKKIIGNRLIIQNTNDDPTEAIFGEAPQAAAADEEAVFGQDDGAGLSIPEVPQVADQPAEGAAPALGGAGLGGAGLGGLVAGDDELREQGGEFLGRVADQLNAAEGRLRAEVRAQLRAANRQLRRDPSGVAGSLKSLLGRVETTANIDPQLRRELEGQVRASIQQASRMEAEFFEQQKNLERRVGGLATQTRLLEETYRREDTLKTLAQQLNALIDEGRYDEADGEVSLAFAKLAGDTITRDSVSGRHFTDETLALQVYDRDRRYREMRERNFVDAFSLVLKSNIPFVDEPPIVYPEADVWQRMSRRRLERYGAIDLVGNNESEKRISAALDDETSHTFLELPLEDAARQISEAHDIPIVVDRRALEEIGLTVDQPVTMDLKNVSLRSFLRLMLRELDLT